jgi:hypothetical protein
LVKPRPRPFSIFQGDGQNKVLDRIGLGETRRFSVPIVIVLVVGVAWGVPAILAWIRRPMLGTWGREWFFYDLAAWSQLVGFLPFAFGSERYIDHKMRWAVRHLRAVTHPDSLERLVDRAGRLGRSRRADIVCVVLAYLFTSTWAIDEVTNGLPSWHSAVTPTGEHFTPAGWWVTLISLPLFTFTWLRWAWKVGVWTNFLYHVSRLRLRLHPAHPDRTAGLGCLSDVQTSFALLLFGSGILFSANTYYKVVLEGTPMTSHTVWGPIVGIVILAPATFLGPLFLFTRKLRRVKEEGLLRYSALGVALTRRFERQWLNARRTGDEMLETPGHSAMADFRLNFENVQRMRVVPLDARSVLELFGSAVGPFVPLLKLFQLPDKLRAILDLVS